MVEALYGLPASFIRALGIIRRFGPELVIGLGGYASGPLVVAGKIKRIRCAIMEQNLRPGLTNRILGRIVDRVFTTFEESASYFPRSKVVRTGNPIRWRSAPAAAKGDKFSLLIFGGSAGAHRINLCVLEALEQLKDLGPHLRVLHQTGEADNEKVRAAYTLLPFESRVVPFIERMDEAYARADLVLCRSGASTVAELALFGKPSILVPYPHAADDHQRWNAEALRKEGAAEMILERELKGHVLANRIRALIQDRKKLEAMGEAARRLAQPEAAQRIVEECWALVRES
jgi:UDP-N-acetylglucosamine--N-acetylmuramyl-(pentapeptide) pyrophosphoryl-undecaprenol N-acetylglucosamine transferase